MSVTGISPVLFREAAELFDHLDRIERFVKSVGPGQSGEHQNIYRTITHAIHLVQEATTDAFRVVLNRERQAGKLSPGEAALVTYQIQCLSNWFMQLHELLVYLPRPEIGREPFDLLEASFRDQYDNISPSIILGSIFNAFQFNFADVTEARIPQPGGKITDLKDIITQKPRDDVLQLAICDQGSPMSWAVLAHEMGHAIDLKFQISEPIADMVWNKHVVVATEPRVFPVQQKLVRNWSRELCADLIAAKALGPAPILAILSMQYCMLPIYPVLDRSKDHPPMHWRLRAVSNFLRAQNKNVDYLESEREFFDQAWLFYLNAALDEPDQEEKNRIIQAFGDLILPLVELLVGKIESLKLEATCIEKSSVVRTLKRLQNSRPVSAQGLERPELIGKLEEYRKEVDAGLPAKDRPAAFNALKRQFEERPLGVGTILLAGHLQRLDTLDIQRATLERFSDMSLIRQKNKFLRRIDAIVKDSIRRSVIHRTIWDTIRRNKDKDQVQPEGA